MKAILKAVGVIERICLSVTVFCVLFMMLLISADVILRKFFNTPIPVSVEFTEDYLMVALVYLSMSYVYTRDGHVRVNMFRGLVPAVLRRPVDSALNFLALVFFGTLTARGVFVTMRAIKLNEFSNSEITYPMAPAYFILVLGGALLCIRILETVFNPDKYKPKEQL